jgi:hypothetical protein
MGERGGDHSMWALDVRQAPRAQRPLVWMRKSRGRRRGQISEQLNTVEFRSIRQGL